MTEYVVEMSDGRIRGLSSEQQVEIGNYFWIEPEEQFARVLRRE